MVSVLIAVLLAALAYLLLAAMTHSGLLALIGAIVVLVASFGYPYRGRL